MAIAEVAPRITDVDVAIAGAGPYGLSIAAHLSAAGVNVRVFGKPMDVWREHMPRGMYLKSEGFASDLFDPNAAFTLRQYCAERGLEYADVGLPVKLETFCSYGLAFAQRFAPQLDESKIVRLERKAPGFELETESGEIVRAARVVVAVGISYFADLPEMFAQLGPQWVSHSARFHDYDAFAGRRVVVIGAGASAIDVALSLAAAGARPYLIARAAKIRFHEPPEVKRPLWKRIRYPRSGLGNNWKSRFFSEMPDAFYRLPEPLRLWLVRKHLGPAPGWSTREPFEASVPHDTGWSIESAVAREDGVWLRAVDADSRVHEIEADHVIAATGYRADIRKVPFLSADLLASIRTNREGSPNLSPGFESSVPGLYFVGLASAASFGSLMRFAYGAGFTARRITARLARNAIASAAG